MKVSEITIETVAEFVRADDAKDEMLAIVLDAAKSYVESYTGIEKEQLDQYEDITTAVLVVCQDMYDNRSAYVEKSNINKVVFSILDMHSRNLL